MKKFLLVIVGAALFLSAACANLTQAEIQGILEKVDSVSGQVTVKLTDGSVVTVDLKDLNLETVKKTLGSPTLEPGSPVTLHRGSDEKVRKVVVKSAEARGTIKNLDTDKKLVTVELKKGGTVEFKVTDATKIELLEDEEGTLADLQVGMKIEAKYNPETSEAVKVEQEEDEKGKGVEERGKPEEAGKGESREGRGRSGETRVEGTIVSVDATTASIVIKLGDGTQTTVKVRPSTLIKVEDKVSSLAQLEAGQKVEVKLNPVTKEAVKIEAEK